MKTRQLHRARRAGRRNGFTLMEVLVACALLAAVIVPLLRAFNANSRAADIFVEIENLPAEAGIRIFRRSGMSLSNYHSLIYAFEGYSCPFIIRMERVFQNGYPRQAS